MSAARGSFSLAAIWESRTSGDLNAGFAFLLDCVVNLFVLSALLRAFGFPVELLQTRIIPGALVAIIIGNLLNIHMARKVSEATGNPNVTAMPLGLDLPTTVGITVTVLGPLFVMLKEDLGDAEQAAMIAWYVGMAATIWMGLIKFGLSFIAGTVQRVLPVTALLGAMLGIAVVWLGANAVLGVFSVPEVGMISMGVMIYALIAGFRIPGPLPGAIAAILLGTAVFYVAGTVGWLPGFEMPVISAPALYPPMVSMGGAEELFGRSIFYMAIIVPFALLIAASTVNLTAGANLLGDDLKAGELIRADAAATILGAFFGNVVQTTPYFGHATYKRLGARTVYSLGVVAVLALGGVFGIVRFLIDVLPDAAIKPILIVVACDIARLAFKGINTDEAPGVAFAAMPAILNFAHVKIGEVLEFGQSALNAAGHGAIRLLTLMPGDWVAGYTLLGALARGYILTGLLWAAAVSYVIERRFTHAVVIFFMSAGLSLFGVIHSVLPNSAIYLPWNLELEDAMAALLPYRFAAAYALAGLTILLFATFGRHLLEAKEAKE